MYHFPSVWVVCIKACLQFAGHKIHRFQTVADCDVGNACKRRICHLANDALVLLADIVPDRIVRRACGTPCQLACLASSRAGRTHRVSATDVNAVAGASVVPHVNAVTGRRTVGNVLRQLHRAAPAGRGVPPLKGVLQHKRQQSESPSCVTITQRRKKICTKMKQK